MRSKKSVYVPVLLIFIIVNTLLLTMGNFFERKNIDRDVLIGANILLCALTLIALRMHTKAIQNPNPNVFVRSVMSATVLKLFILGGGVFLYIGLAGETKNEKSILIAGILYFVYAFAEVRSALALNRSKNEKN